MLRITTSHSAEGAKKYFDVSLKTSDYYTKDIGTWGGKGAEMLGLKGEVERKDFVALVNNWWPGANGKRLTARMNKTRLEDVKDKKTGLPVIHPETGDVQKREVSKFGRGVELHLNRDRKLRCAEHSQQSRRLAIRNLRSQVDLQMTQFGRHSPREDFRNRAPNLCAGATLTTSISRNPEEYGPQNGIQPFAAEVFDRPLPANK
jgi:hypothetical protein